MNQTAPPDRPLTGRLPSLLLVFVVLTFAGYVYVTNTNTTDPLVVTTEPANSNSPRPGFIPAANVDVLPQLPVHPIGHVATGNGLPRQVVGGDTVGLYGGTQTNACDAARIGAFLDAHPALASAWAEALRIRQSDIHPYLGSLTALTLRTDTAVTNHGYQNGVATPFQSVLQAGTAVLVDAEGLPRVRCRCGNPLQTPAPPVDVHYEGTTWKGFEPESVTAVSPATVVVNTFVIVLPDGTKAARLRATNVNVPVSPVIAQRVDAMYARNGTAPAGPSDADNSTGSPTPGGPAATTDTGEAASGTASPQPAGTADPIATETAASGSAPTEAGTQDHTATTDTGNAQDTNGQTADPGGGTAPTGNPDPGNEQPGNEQPGNEQPGNDQSGNDQSGNKGPESPGSDSGGGDTQNESGGGASAEST